MGYARFKARDTMAGNGKVVQVQLAGDETSRFAILLGTTSQFVFLYDADSRRVEILPNENIQSLTLYAPR